jgi:hypothetical protein
MADTNLSAFLWSVADLRTWVAFPCSSRTDRLVPGPWRSP